MCLQLCIHSLNPQLLAVAQGEAVISERAQHHRRVNHVLLEAQEPNVQPLKPHQHGVLCNTSKSEEIQLLTIKRKPGGKLVNLDNLNCSEHKNSGAHQGNQSINLILFT